MEPESLERSLFSLSLAGFRRDGVGTESAPTVLPLPALTNPARSMSRRSANQHREPRQGAAAGRERRRRRPLLPGAALPAEAIRHIPHRVGPGVHRGLPDSAAGAVGHQ